MTHRCSILVLTLLTACSANSSGTAPAPQSGLSCQEGQTGLVDVDNGLSEAVNVYAFAGMPSAPELEALGVARVSVGCGPMQATLGLTRRIAVELRDRGTWDAMSDGALSVRDVNALMTGDPSFPR